MYSPAKAWKRETLWQILRILPITRVHHESLARIEGRQAAVHKDVPERTVRPIHRIVHALIARDLIGPRVPRIVRDLIGNPGHPIARDLTGPRVPRIVRDLIVPRRVLRVRMPPVIRVTDHARAHPKQVARAEIAPTATVGSNRVMSGCGPTFPTVSRVMNWTKTYFWATCVD